MEGTKFGKWTVVKKVPGPRRGQHFECQCGCGYIKIISLNVLKNGKSRQCYTCHRAPVVFVGDKFGSWQVVSQYNHSKTRSRRYVCQCICGNLRIIANGDLRSGKSTQCTSCHISKKNTSHGLRKTKTYTIWSGLIQRCYNPKNQDYALYGGRGIAVHEPWKTFEGFLKDMGICPNGLEIDRIDVDGNYEPGNCRWVTHKENVANRRSSSQNRNKYILVDTTKLCTNCMSKTTCVTSEFNR